LFSRQRYESFQKYQIPEIFRVPLEELCLQSKNLAPVNLSIADFIGLVPEAPSPAVIKRAVKVIVLFFPL
jgi:HrpA-like RNA helicase